MLANGERLKAAFEGEEGEERMKTKNLIIIIIIIILHEIWGKFGLPLKSDKTNHEMEYGCHSKRIWLER